jgi:hypothetical protein
MLEDLPKKNMKELREIRKQIGLAGQKGESAESLRLRIGIALQPGLLNELNKNPVLADKQKPVLDITIKPHWLTAQDVVEALRPYQERIKLAFYDANGQPSSGNAKTWRVQNGPAEDSGSMTMPIEMIRRKAEQIALARFPAKIARTGTEFDGCLSV